MKLFLFLASIFGFLGVAIGAFGAHAVKSRISPEMLDIYHTGTQYQMYHSLALLAVAILLPFYPESRMLTWTTKARSAKAEETCSFWTAASMNFYLPMKAYGASVWG